MRGKVRLRQHAIVTDQSAESESSGFSIFTRYAGILLQANTWKCISIHTHSGSRTLHGATRSTQSATALQQSYAPIRIELHDEHPPTGRTTAKLPIGSSSRRLLLSRHNVLALFRPLSARINGTLLGVTPILPVLLSIRVSINYRAIFIFIFFSELCQVHLYGAHIFVCAINDERYTFSEQMANLFLYSASYHVCTLNTFFNRCRHRV